MQERATKPDRFLSILSVVDTLVRKAGTLEFWQGLYKIEIVDKNVKLIWSHLNETEFCVDFKSVSIAQRAPPVFLNG